MAEQNPRSEPTGAEGRTPGLASIVRATVFTGPGAPADPRRAAPVQRAAPVKRATRLPTMNQKQMVDRGLSTSPASTARAKESRYRMTQRSEPQGEIVGAIFQSNVGDEPRFGYDYRYLARKTTVGTLPAPVKRARPKPVQPAITVRQYATDQFGRARVGISVRSIARRSVGLPR